MYLCSCFDVTTYFNMLVMIYVMVDFRVIWLSIIWHIATVVCDIRQH